MAGFLASLINTHFERGAASKAEANDMTLFQYAEMVADHIQRGGKITVPLMDDFMSFDHDMTFEEGVFLKREHKTYETVVVTGDVLRCLYQYPALKEKVGHKMIAGLAGQHCFIAGLSYTTKNDVANFIREAMKLPVSTFGRRDFKNDT